MLAIIVLLPVADHWFVHSFRNLLLSASCVLGLAWMPQGHDPVKETCSLAWRGFIDVVGDQDTQPSHS